MASYVFDQTKNKMATGGLNITGDILKIALVTNEITDKPEVYSSYTLWSEIKGYDIKRQSGYNDDGYTEGGEVLQGVRIKDPSTDVDGDNTLDITVYANDIVYPVSNIDADGAVIYKKTAGSGSGSNSEGELIAVIDIRTSNKTVSSTNGAFTIVLNGGFLIIR